SVVTELSGEHVLSSITVRDTKTGEERIIKADEKDGIFGVFMFVGLNPNTELFKDKIATENGYVLTDDEMRTNIPGVYAAGDIRKKSLRQVVTACSDGAIAAVQAERDLAAGLIG
ncbi:MAG: FAD-dependent oxidoreductase, partial [Clostridiaceae bacterium]|nr:FAD-dependent oxidoreductase [Clostridiaceae bacterium]